MKTSVPQMLVNGTARIAFDRTFAGTIDTRTPYLVFVTPNGESRGLYVQKTPSGFSVHENGAGPSTRPQRGSHPRIRQRR